MNNETVSTSSVQIVLSAIDFFFFFLWSVPGDIPSGHTISSLLFEDFIDHLAISLMDINLHSHTMHVYNIYSYILYRHRHMYVTYPMSMNI